MLSPAILSAFRKNVDANLKVKDNNSVIQWIDIDRFMDQSLILFLRFNKLIHDNINRIYFAWTLFTVDFLEFDQIYLTIKYLCGPSKKIRFRYSSKQGSNTI